MRADASDRLELDQRLERFHSVSLERVLGEIAYLRDSGDTVLAGGSLAYGLGNGLSDLDLIISGPNTTESSRVPLEHFVESLRVDVWKLAQDLIEGSFVRAEDALADDQAIHGAFGDIDHEDELKLLHRISSGVVIDGEGLEFGRPLDYQRVAADLVVREYVERMRSTALLAQVSLSARRPIAAVANARLAIEAALNAAVVDRGFAFSGDKWLRQRLLVDCPDLAGVYAPFTRLPADPASEAGSFVSRAVDACQDLLGYDLEVEAVVPAANWRNTDVRFAKIGPDRLLLSTRFGALWELQEHEAEAWQQLVALGAEEPGGVWGLGTCDEAALTLCLRLHEVGALELRWQTGIPLTTVRNRPGAEV